MACVDPEGRLSPVARKVLDALTEGGTAADVAAVAQVPLYRARASLRELVAAGLVTQVDGGDGYQLTDDGRAALQN